jgi:hypothetical protein
MFVYCLLHVNTEEGPRVEYEWGKRARQPLHRDYFLIYFASPSTFFRQ